WVPYRPSAPPVTASSEGATSAAVRANPSGSPSSRSTRAASTRNSAKTPTTAGAPSTYPANMASRSPAHWPTKHSAAADPAINANAKVSHLENLRYLLCRLAASIRASDPSMTTNMVDPKMNPNIGTPFLCGGCQRVANTRANTATNSSRTVCRAAERLACTTSSRPALHRAEIQVRTSSATRQGRTRAGDHPAVPARSPRPGSGRGCATHPGAAASPTRAHPPEQEIPPAPGGLGGLGPPALSVGPAPQALRGSGCLTRSRQPPQPPRAPRVLRALVRAPAGQRPQTGAVRPPAGEWPPAGARGRVGHPQALLFSQAGAPAVVVQPVPGGHVRHRDRCSSKSGPPPRTGVAALVSPMWAGHGNELWWVGRYSSSVVWSGRAGAWGRSRAGSQALFAVRHR